MMILDSGLLFGPQYVLQPCCNYDVINVSLEYERAIENRWRGTIFRPNNSVSPRYRLLTSLSRGSRICQSDRPQRFSFATASL